LDVCAQRGSAAASRGCTPASQAWARKQGNRACVEGCKGSSAPCASVAPGRVAAATILSLLLIGEEVLCCFFSLRLLLQQPDATPTRCSHLRASLTASARTKAIRTPWRRRGPTKAVAAAVGTFAPADGLLPDAARGCERLAERGGSPARRAAWRAACCGSSRHSARYSYPARGDQRAIRAIEQQPIGAGCHACSDQGRRPHSRRRARASVSGDGLQRSPHDQVCVCVCVCVCCAFCARARRPAAAPDHDHATRC
jgi:hypothetical protein